MTLPRYQNMGIQYADLPRLSTAGIEAGANVMGSIGQSLDRMTQFVYEKGVTDAQRKAKEYAISNPLTKTQVDEALESGQGLKVPGAGRVFQQTYQKVQANLLSTELQLETKKSMTAVIAAIESGAPIDLKTVEMQLRDAIDGYTSTIMALDPDEAIKFKAAMTTAGNAIYQKAADRAIKIRQMELNAEFDNAVNNVGPILEAIIAAAGSVDAETGLPVDVERLIEIERQPFLNSVAITGTNEHLKKFNAAVQEAKQNALVGYAVDRTRYETASQALVDINKDDFGPLSGVWKGLTSADKQKVKDGVMKSFANDYTASQQAKAVAQEAAKQEWSALSIEFLGRNTTAARKRQIVARGLELQQITLTTAESLLKPPSDSEASSRNPVLFVQLNDMIQRGSISTLEQLMPYRGQLSATQFQTLGTGLTSTQGRQAIQSMNRYVGIRENQFVPEDKNAKATVIMNFYEEELNRQVPGPSGVPTFQSPTQAMEEAIKRFADDKTIQNALAAQESIRRRIDGVLREARVSLPDLPLEQIDPAQIRGLSNTQRKDLESLLKRYKDSVSGMSGR